MTTPNNLPANSSSDPFTLVYCSLWDMLESHQGFVGLVKTPNRIKWLGNKLGPRKDNVTDTDLPEVCIVPAEDGEHCEPQTQTGQSGMVLRFDVKAESGNQRLDSLGVNGVGGAIYPVAWELFRALVGWQQQMLQTEYQGRRFASMVKNKGLTIKLTHSSESRGQIGWSCRWRYEISCNFSTLAVGPVAIA